MLNKLKSATRTLPNRLGGREADELMSTFSGDACLDALHRAIADGDADAFVIALVAAVTATTKFETWCASESATFASTFIDVGESDDGDEDILRVAQSAINGDDATRARIHTGMEHPWDRVCYTCVGQCCGCRKSAQ